MPQAQLSLALERRQAACSKLFQHLFWKKWPLSILPCLLQRTKIFSLRYRLLLDWHASSNENRVIFITLSLGLSEQYFHTSWDLLYYYSWIDWPNCQRRLCRAWTLRLYFSSTIFGDCIHLTLPCVTHTTKWRRLALLRTPVTKVQLNSEIASRATFHRLSTAPSLRHIRQIYHWAVRQSLWNVSVTAHLQHTRKQSTASSFVSLLYSLKSVSSRASIHQLKSIHKNVVFNTIQMVVNVISLENISIRLNENGLHI